jgi:putative tricarboxylic transport membrane protein
MKKNELIFNGICIAFFGFMFVNTIPLLGMGRFGEMGSGFWPIISLGGALALSIALFVANLKRAGKAGGKEPPKQTPADKAEAEERAKRFVLGVVCLLVYIILTPWIGFILSTFLYIPAFAMSLGERRRNVLIVSPILVTTIIVLVFAKFITIPFPKGVGIFASFSRFFY